MAYFPRICPANFKWKRGDGDLDPTCSNSTPPPAKIELFCSRETPSPTETLFTVKSDNRLIEKSKAGAAPDVDDAPTVFTKTPANSLFLSFGGKTGRGVFSLLLVYHDYCRNSVHRKTRRKTLLFTVAPLTEVNIIVSKRLHPSLEGP